MGNGCCMSDLCLDIRFHDLHSAATPESILVFDDVRDDLGVLCFASMRRYRSATTYEGRSGSALPSGCQSSMLSKTKRCAYVLYTLCQLRMTCIACRITPMVVMSPNSIAMKVSPSGVQLVCCKSFMELIGVAIVCFFSVLKVNCKIKKEILQKYRSTTIVRLCVLENI